METQTSSRWQRRPGTLDRYLNEISAYPLIDRGEEQRLAREIRSGNAAAIDELVRANLRFVVSVAKRYQNLGVPLQDLINEGNLGLLRAARRFDGARGTKFISYAVWWIRQAILQALAEQGRSVRIPMNRAGDVSRVARSRAALRQELGRDPTVLEVARSTGLDRTSVEELLTLTVGAVSLDQPVSAEDDGRLMDYLPAEDCEADRAALDLALRRSVEHALNGLKPREATVLRLYYGLDDQRSMTLEEIGGQMGVTRERIRQIKEKALNRLRHASRRRPLESFCT